MKKFAVIGNPINHSLSPLMHESIFKQIGLKASYEKIQIEPFVKSIKIKIPFGIYVFFLFF